VFSPLASRSILQVMDVAYSATALQFLASVRPCTAGECKPEASPNCLRSEGRIRGCYRGFRAIRGDHDFRGLTEFELALTDFQFLDFGVESRRWDYECDRGVLLVPLIAVADMVGSFSCGSRPRWTFASVR
jgi:hypothetical protein